MTAILTKILIGLLALIIASIVAIAFGGKKPSGQAKEDKAIRHQQEETFIPKEEVISEISESRQYETKETDDGRLEININVDYEPDYMDYEPPEEEDVESEEGVFNKEYWEKWDREAFSDQTKPVLEKYGDILVQEGIIDRGEVETLKKAQETKPVKEEKGAVVHRSGFGVFSEDYRILPFKENELIEY